MELGVHRVSQSRKGPQGPRAVGLGLREAVVLGMWVQVQFLPLRLPLRGFQREWLKNPLVKLDTHPATQHPAPCLSPVGAHTGHV